MEQNLVSQEEHSQGPRTKAVKKTSLTMSVVAKRLLVGCRLRAAAVQLFTRDDEGILSSLSLPNLSVMS
jgi:hypothetical protein